MIPTEQLSDTLLRLAESLAHEHNGIGDACTGCILRAQSLRAKRIEEAAKELYYSGHWHCDRAVDEIGLWTNLRDAVGFEPGHAPKPVAES